MNKYVLRYRGYAKGLVVEFFDNSQSAIMRARVLIMTDVIMMSLVNCETGNLLMDFFVDGYEPKEEDAA